jgi:hypothetical protein
VKSLIVFNPSNGASFAATLPASPADGATRRLKYIGPFSASFPITIAANSGQTIDGLSAIPLIGENASIDLVYVASLSMWVVS